MANMELRHRILLGCGVLQLIFGLSMFICGILLVVWKSLAASFGVGFWGGIWAILTGALGTAGGMMRKKGLETAFMVLSILAAVLFCMPIISISYATSIFEDGCEFTMGQDLPMADMIDRVTSLATNLGIGGDLTAMANTAGLEVSQSALIQSVCATKMLSPSFTSASNIASAVSNGVVAAQQKISTDFTAVIKNGRYVCICLKGYDSMYAAEMALLAFGLLMLLVTIISASIACCAVCSCCGATDNLIRPFVERKCTKTEFNGNTFQQVNFINFHHNITSSTKVPKGYDLWEHSYIRG